MDEVDNKLLQTGLMSVREVAAFLSVGRSFVYKEMSRGALPWLKCGRARRIPRRAVLDYAATRLAATTDERDATRPLLGRGK